MQFSLLCSSAADPLNGFANKCNFTAESIQRLALTAIESIVLIIIKVQYATPTNYPTNHSAAESSGKLQPNYLYKTRVNVVRVAYQIHDLYSKLGGKRHLHEFLDFRDSMVNIMFD